LKKLGLNNNAEGNEHQIMNLVLLSSTADSRLPAHCSLRINGAYTEESDAIFSYNIPTLILIKEEILKIFNTSFCGC
jgi:hypothetical protein